MIAFLAEHWDEIALAVTSVVTAASIIVKLTPTPKDDAILARVVKILEIVSLNKKNAQ